jgi:hypothetical protein
MLFSCKYFNGAKSSIDSGCIVLQLTIRFKDIVTLTKEKTARVIPNALQVCTRDDRYFFTSFNSRDKTFHILIQLWQLAQNDQPLSNQEFTQWVHQSYGDQLGLTSSDEEELTTGHSRHSSYEPCVTNGADKVNAVDYFQTVPHCLSFKFAVVLLLLTILSNCLTFCLCCLLSVGR